MSTIQSKPAPVGGLQLHNFALAARDLDAMIAWYETVLGFAVSERGRFDAVSADYAMLEAGGMRVTAPISGHASIAAHAAVPGPAPMSRSVVGWKVGAASATAAIAAEIAANVAGMRWTR